MQDALQGIEETEATSTVNNLYEALKGRIGQREAIQRALVLLWYHLNTAGIGVEPRI